MCTKLYIEPLLGLVGSIFHSFSFISRCLFFMTFIYHSNHQIHPGGEWLIAEGGTGQLSFAWDPVVGTREPGEIIILIKLDVTGKCAQTSNKDSALFQDSE